MFAQNEILVFTPGRKQECLDRLAWIHSLMAPQPGFKEAIVAKYLGDGTRHTIMRFWEDEAAYQAFRATPDGNYGRGRPEGLYVNEPVITPLIGLGEMTGTAEGNFLIKLERAIEPSAWEAFGTHAQGVMANSGGLPGLAWVGAFKGKDKDAAITVIRMADRAAFDSLIESPFYANANTLPEGVTQVRLECFEIVSEVFPKQ
nr:J25 [uncultured bacterium]